jgi:hypothetical protein
MVGQLAQPDREQALAVSTREAADSVLEPSHARGLSGDQAGHGTVRAEAIERAADRGRRVPNSTNAASTMSSMTPMAPRLTHRSDGGMSYDTRKAAAPATTSSASDAPYMMF